MTEENPVLNGIDYLEEEEEEEGEEELLKTEPCLCLFCKTEQASATAILDHCRTEHGVNLPSITAQLGRGHYNKWFVGVPMDL